MTATEAQSFIAGGGEAKKSVVPMMDGKNSFGIVGSHKSENCDN